MLIDAYIERLKTAVAMPTKTTVTVDCVAVVELLATGEPTMVKATYSQVKIINTWCRTKGLVFKYSTKLENEYYELRIDLESMKVYKPAGPRKAKPYISIKQVRKAIAATHKGEQLAH